MGVKVIHQETRAAKASRPDHAIWLNSLNVGILATSHCLSVTLSPSPPTPRRLHCARFLDSAFTRASHIEPHPSTPHYVLEALDEEVGAETEVVMFLQAEARATVRSVEQKPCPY
jgi:hypothetical protein